MSSKYRQQAKRAVVVPPHASLHVLRKVSGLTQAQVCSRINEALGTPDRVKPGTLSAIEIGIRGASHELLSAIEYAYGLEPGDLTTSYLPRRSPSLEAVGQ